MEGRARRQSADVVQSFDIIQFCCHFGVPRLVCVTANLSSTSARVKEAVLFSHIFTCIEVVVFLYSKIMKRKFFPRCVPVFPTLRTRVIWTPVCKVSWRSDLLFKRSPANTGSGVPTWKRSSSGDVPGYLFHMGWHKGTKTNSIIFSSASCLSLFLISSGT